MRFVIVGGGTAGWITALLLRHVRPWDDVTLVASSRMGILGAGEGTTPHFFGDFLDEVGIPIGDMVREVGATVKNGIRFTNWNGDGTSYFHPFNDDVGGPPNLGLLHPRDLPDEAEVCFPARISNENRVPLTPLPPLDRPGGPDARAGFRRHSLYALHFDAHRLARYLARVGEARRVRHVDARVTGLRRAPNGDVTRLKLEGGDFIPCDFVFDCTGFHRLILGKAFETSYRDLSRVLPCDRALPFLLPLEGDPPPYTEARAMKAGWAWKIPASGRFGCGYVYDSDFLSEDEARAEVREVFGEPLSDLDKVFRFQPSYVEDVWVANVVGVGLSAAFLEPLEATSIWVTLMTLKELLKVHLPLGPGDPRARHELNVFHRTLHRRIVDFLYLHYVTRRVDTPFWATFTERTETPEAVRDLLGGGGLRWFFEEDHRLAGHPAPFSAASWTWIALGLHQMDRRALEGYWRTWQLENGWKERLDEVRTRVDRVARDCISHQAFLELAARQSARARPA